MVVLHALLVESCFGTCSPPGKGSTSLRPGCQGCMLLTAIAQGNAALQVALACCINKSLCCQWTLRQQCLPMFHCLHVPSID